jgi:hypothetical protein
MDLSIVAIGPRLCVPVAQQRRAFLALAATLTLFACAGSPESGVTPTPLPASTSASPATPSTFSVSGTIRGAQGPLPDARVELEGPGRYNTRTDAEGVYRFLEVERGEYMLRASSPGYASAEQSLTIDADTARDVPLQSASSPSPSPSSDPPRYRLYGRIVDRLDGSVSGARVELVSGPDAGVSVLATNPARYEFPNLRAGTYQIRVSREGYQTRDVQQNLAADTELNIRLDAAPLLPPYTFTGMVRDSRRNAVGGAEVWLYSNSSPIDDRRGTGFTDGSGRYTIVLQRTAQTVRAMKDGYVPNDAAIFGSSNSSATFVTDVVITKIDRYTLFSPTSLRVGEQLRVEGRVELDDGSSVTGGCVCSRLVSSDPSVVAVDGTGYSGFIRGVTPGSATITGTYYGVTTTLVVRVSH